MVNSRSMQSLLVLIEGIEESSPPIAGRLVKLEGLGLQLPFEVSAAHDGRVSVALNRLHGLEGKGTAVAAGVLAGATHTAFGLVGHGVPRAASISSMKAWGSSTANFPCDHDSGSAFLIISLSRSNAATIWSSLISPSSGKSSLNTSEGSISRGMCGIADAQSHVLQTYIAIEKVIAQAADIEKIMIAVEVYQWFTIPIFGWHCSEYLCSFF